jgi:hypothetical protein
MDVIVSLYWVCMSRYQAAAASFKEKEKEKKLKASKKAQHFATSKGPVSYSAKLKTVHNINRFLSHTLYLFVCISCDVIWIIH